LKIDKQPIPEEMKKTIVEVEPAKIEESRTAVILKEIRDEEVKNKKSNRRATFFVNLIYLMSLVLSVIMIIRGIDYAIPSMAFIALGVLAFNIFIYIESRRTKKHIKTIDSFYSRDAKQ